MNFKTLLPLVLSVLSSVGLTLNPTTSHWLGAHSIIAAVLIAIPQIIHSLLPSIATGN